jgi:hypothetical protein
MGFMKIKVNSNFILCIIQIVVAIGAIPVGILLLMDPGGQKIGTTIAVLRNSPFIDFFFPGLFLLIFLGIGNLSSAIVTFLKIEVAGFLGLVFGLILMVWIVFQIYWIGYNNFLQPLFFILGGIEAVIGYQLLRSEINSA